MQLSRWKLHMCELAREMLLKTATVGIALALRAMRTEMTRPDLASPTNKNVTETTFHLKDFNFGIHGFTGDPKLE